MNEALSSLKSQVLEGLDDALSMLENAMSAWNDEDADTVRSELQDFQGTVENIQGDVDARWLDIDDPQDSEKRLRRGRAKAGTLRSVIETSSSFSNIQRALQQASEVIGNMEELILRELPRSDSDVQNIDSDVADAIRKLEGATSILDQNWGKLFDLVVNFEGE